jgi:protein phosphatase
MTKTRPTSPRQRRTPADDDIDVYGLTHTGLVRKTNQDHFLISSLRKHMQVHHTSLPKVDQLPLEGARLAYVAMVADGVGSGSRGEDASRYAIEKISDYVAHSMECYYTSDGTDEQAFSDALEEAAMRCHAAVAKQAQEEDPDGRGMATTLTLALSVWPQTYLLQIGDSRCYLFQDDVLTQISRDQTMAQELIDRGVFSRSEADKTRWAHVLSSAIGGKQTAPVVTRIDRKWNDVGLLCSDGLTKHVSDDQIAERLRTMTSAKQVCEDLLQDALDDGGSDNITIIVGRVTQKH